MFGETLRPSGYRGVLVDLATVIISLASLTLAASIGLARLHPQVGPRGPVADIEVKNWEQYLNPGHLVGPSGAAVIVLEFGDYECSFCRRFESAYRGLTDAFPNDVALVYRHFPLPYHANAYRAARFAECAADQMRFAVTHRLLYELEDLSVLDPMLIAEAADIPDRLQFRECTADNRTDRRIDSDREAGTAIGVRGTPAVIVNGTYLASPDSLTLHRFVANILAQQPPR